MRGALETMFPGNLLCVRVDGGGRDDEGEGGLRFSANQSSKVVNGT